MRNPFHILMILFSVVIFIGCSSSTRFTSDTKERFGEEKSTRTGVNENSEQLNATNKLNVIETSHAIASFYAHKFHGRTTANGEKYDMYALTAAHISYPFNTQVRVTNLSNNKNVVLRINDRKPDTNGRAIDLSYRAAELLNMIDQGIAEVLIEVLEWGDE